MSLHCVFQRCFVSTAFFFLVSVQLQAMEQKGHRRQNAIVDWNALEQGVGLALLVGASGAEDKGDCASLRGLPPRHPPSRSKEVVELDPEEETARIGRQLGHLKDLLVGLEQIRQDALKSLVPLQPLGGVGFLQDFLYRCEGGVVAFNNMCDRIIERRQQRMIARCQQMYASGGSSSSVEPSDWRSPYVDDGLSQPTEELAPDSSLLVATRGSSDSSDSSDWIEFGPFTDDGSQRTTPATSEVGTPPHDSDVIDTGDGEQLSSSFSFSSVSDFSDDCVPAAATVLLDPEGVLLQQASNLQAEEGVTGR